MKITHPISGVQCPTKNHKKNKRLNISECIQKVILRKTMRTTINFYLVNLSAADLLSTLWCPLHRCFFLTVSVNCLRHFQGNMLTVLSQYSYVLTHWISPPFLLSLLAELTEEYLLPAIFCKISAFYSIVCIVASVSFFFVFGFCVFLVVQDSSIGALVTR